MLENSFEENKQSRYYYNYYKKLENESPSFLQKIGIMQKPVVVSNIVSYIPPEEEKKQKFIITQIDTDKKEIIEINPIKIKSCCIIM